MKKLPRSVYSFPMRLMALLVLPAVLFSQALAACDPVAESMSQVAYPPIIVDYYKATAKLLNSVPDAADVLLIGDSLLAGWSSHAERDFPGRSVFNFSVGGDRVQQILWRFQHAELSQLRPRAIAIMAGTNNLADRGATGCAAFSGMSLLISIVKELWPNVPIFVLSIVPRGPDFRSFDEERIEFNLGLRGVDSNYKNVFSVMIDDDEFTCGQYGRPRLVESSAICEAPSAYKCRNYRGDNLHFTADAYQYLRELLRGWSSMQLGYDVFK